MKKDKVLTKEILAVCEVASKIKFKTELACVQIKPDTIIATDTFKAIIIKRKDFFVDNYPGGELAKLSNKGVLINAKELKQHLKFVKYKSLPDIDEKAIVIEKDKDVEIQVVDMKRGSNSVFNFRKVNEEYPDIEKIIPTNKPLAKVELNADYLIDLLKCFKGENINIEIRGKNEAVIIENRNKDKTGIIMGIENLKDE